MTYAKQAKVIRYCIWWASVHVLLTFVCEDHLKQCEIHFIYIQLLAKLASPAN